MDLKRGAKAVESLEENASRLSKLIPELAKVENAIDALKTAEKSSQKQLQAYDEKLSTLEGQLTESLQLKLAEGLAEVSSRTKDLYDFGLKESEKTKSEINELKKEIEKLNTGLSDLGTTEQKIQKSINQLSSRVLIAAISAIALLLALFFVFG